MKTSLSFSLLLSLILFFFFSCTSFPFGDRTYSFEKGLTHLTNEIIHSLEDQELYRVAINDFIRIDNERTLLGKAVSEELTTGFFMAGPSFSLVERSQLEAALSELQLNMSAVFDEKQATEVGRLVGADALVIGSITPFEEYIKINARIFSVEDGKVISAAAVKIAMSDEINAMLNELLIPVNEKTEGPATSGDASEVGKPKLVQNIDNFKIELAGLRREGAKLWADFIVTYQGREQEEWIGFYNGRIVDNEGREYKPTGGGTLEVSSGWGGLDCIKDVPVAGTIPFSVGTAELDSIAVLEVTFRDRGKLYFKNLSID